MRERRPVPCGMLQRVTLRRISPGRRDPTVASQLSNKKRIALLNELGSA